MTKRGFTLVELSIVLVIIGLLIGGILAGQSMIATSKVDAEVHQIGQFDAMVTNYVSKYNCLVSDCSVMTYPNEPAGNNDGLITQGSLWPDYAGWFMGEIGNFWHYLEPDVYASLSQQAGYTIMDYGGLATTSGPKKDVPLSKMGKSGSFVIVSAITTGPGGTVNRTNPANYYVIIGPTQAQLATAYNYFTPTTSANSAVSPAELLALDTKIDDGKANSGMVMSGSIGTAWGINTTPISTCSAADVYAVSTNSGYECTPLIRLGVQTGNPM